MPAWAQAGIADARSAVAAVLADVERNLITAEGIDMNVADFRAKETNFNGRMNDLNQRITAMTAYCTGTFPEPEYSARKAQCDSLQSGYESLGGQMELERANLLEQILGLQEREAERGDQWTVIMGQLTSAMQQFAILCSGLPAPEFQASCRVPPAPGPRTRELVQHLEGLLLETTGSPNP